MNKLYLGFLIVVFIAEGCFAQTDPAKKKSDRITIFDRNDRIDSIKAAPLPLFQEKLDTSKNGKMWNIFKLNPFLLIVGDLPIYYERQLTKSSSAEIALGVTFDNYSFDFLNDQETGIDFLGDNFYNLQNAVWHAGMGLKADYRFYPAKSVTDGIYVSPEFDYRLNGISIPLDDNSNSNSSSGTTNLQVLAYNGKYETFEVKALLGYETEIFSTDNVVGEIYTGIGVRKYSIRYISQEEVQVSAPSSIYYSGYTYVPETYTELKPHFYLGVRIGFRIR